MKILDTKIPEVKIIEPDVFGDHRGWFMETWSEPKYAQFGFKPVQDNESLTAQKGTLRCVVSKGTYVRTLVNDLGEKLGTLAVLHSLVRTRSGAYPIEQCRSFEDCERAMADGTMQQLLLPTDSLFTEHPAVTLTDEGAERIARGAVVFPRQADTRPGSAGALCRVYHEGRFLMLGQVRELDKGGLGLFVYKNFK